MTTLTESPPTKLCKKCKQPREISQFRWNWQAKCHGRTCIPCLIAIRGGTIDQIVPQWEIHVGSVRLYIVGPGPHAMHRCSEPVYQGKIGTPEEWAIARKALRILANEHMDDMEADATTIQRVLERVRKEKA